MVPAAVTSWPQTVATGWCHREDVRDDQTAAVRVVEALEAEGLVTPETEARSREVVAQALAGRGRDVAAAPGMPKLVEVVAYLGGALVLAAGFLFLVRSWTDLGDVGQVSFLGAVALVLAVAGGIARPASGPGGVAGTDVRRRLGGTLLTGAAVASGFAVGVSIDNWAGVTSTGDVFWPGVGGALVAAVLSAVAYRVSSTAVGLLGMLGGAVSAAGNISGSIAGDEGLFVGTLFFSLAVVWLVVTELGAFEQQTIARALGVALALVGGQAASFGDHSAIGYLMSALVAGVGVWLYLTRLDWPYLAGAVLAVTLVVPEAVSDWTGGSLGAVGGVLLAGITLLGASYAGYRLRREATD